MKITLAICTNRGIKPKTAQCLLDLVNTHKDIDFHVLVAERGYTIAENRNYCVIQAQRNNSDYLLFIDDDMVFPKDTLEKLMSHKVGVVGVNSYSRCLPPASTVGLMDAKGQYMHPDKHTAWQMQIPTEPFICYFVGAGVMLINMKVFDDIKAPYFAFTTDKKGQVVNGEDGTFCDKARKVGFDIWCDPTIKIGHLGEFEYGKPKEDYQLVVHNLNTHVSI
jgi:GT2 family glycosyltransferase